MIAIHSCWWHKVISFNLWNKVHIWFAMEEASIHMRMAEFDSSSDALLYQVELPADMEKFI